MCLKRLNKAMKEARKTTKESIFVENMRTLIAYSYNPCYHLSGNDDVWEELQGTVSEFLVVQKSWLLKEAVSGLICEEEQLTKDILIGLVDLLIDTDKLRMKAEREREALKTELAQSKSAKKKRRQALTI